MTSDIGFIKKGWHCVRQRTVASNALHSLNPGVRVEQALCESFNALNLTVCFFILADDLSVLRRRIWWERSGGVAELM